MNRYFYILVFVFATMPYSQDPPDPLTKVSSSVHLGIWGYTFNQLSGNGIASVIDGSIGAFSYGNPALLNLHNKITMEFSGYDESMENIYPNYSFLIDRHIVPFSSFNIILPFKYKIGISYNNLYSWESGEMEVTTVASPDGTGESSTVSLSCKLNNYSLSIANSLMILNNKIHYGLQLNKKVFRQSFYTTAGKGYGISIKSGLLHEIDDIQFGVSFETETTISIEFEGEGLQVVDEDGITVLERTNSFNTYLPAKLNLGFLILLTKKVESYIEYDRSYWLKISDYDYDKDDMEYSMGIRYSPNNKLAVTLGYYKIKTHMQNQYGGSNLFDESPFENELVNFGLVYKFKSFVVDLGYATVVKNKYYDANKQSFIKFSIAKHLDNFFNPKAKP